MSQLLTTFIIVLVVIFVVVAVIMATGMLRSRNRGRNVSTVTAPIPDREQSNRQTRVDNAPDTSSYNGTSAHNEREHNRP